MAAPISSIKDPTHDLRSADGDPVTVVSDVVALLALGALLVVAIRGAGWRAELVVSVLTSAAVLAVGLVGPSQLRDTVRELLPVVIFLVAILVVSEVCDRAGLFAAAARVVGGAARGRPAILLLGVFALAAAVTTVLSLDATVVLLTPVVVGAAASLGTSDRPTTFACLRMANSASLLLPVSNLTNLLAVAATGLSFVGFAARMAPVLAVVLVVEYAGLWLLFRRDLAQPTRPREPVEGPSVPVVPVVAVAVMLLAFGVGSQVDIAPAWPAAVAAVVLSGWGLARGLIGPGDVVRAANPSFALFVLALGVVVAGVSSGFVGGWVADLVPARASSFGALLGLAVLATVAAALLTNLSATLLVVPLVAPLGPTAVLAALLGLNIGSGLTWTGSLANLLWRRSLISAGRSVDAVAFHRVSLTITPVSLVAGVAVLALLG